MKRNHKLLALAGAVLAMIALVWVVAVPLGKINQSTGESTVNSAPQASTPEEKIVAGKVDDQRKILAQKTQELILEANAISEAYGGLDEANAALNDGDFSKLDDEYLAKFRLTDYFATDESLRKALQAAVLNMSAYVAQGSTNAAEIPLTSEDGWKNVFVDMEAGQAFVPLGIFVTNGATLSLEFSYVADEWVFTPYSFVDMVSALAATQVGTPPAQGSGS